MIGCIRIALAMAGFLAVLNLSWAQTYPAKSIRLVMSAPPGGGADVLVRPIAQKLSESMGQPVVVDNRPGAAGQLAGQATVLAPADGYTILFTTASGASILPSIAKRLPYDPARDFTPVAMVATSPLIVTVHPSMPATSLKGLIAFAKTRRPGEILYASNGLGSISHLATEMFNRAAGIVMTHVPYKGGSPAALAAASGHVQLTITAVPTLILHIRANRLRALAVTGSRRSSVLPGLPTVSETGLNGYEAVQWYGVFGPKNLPDAITSRLYEEIAKAVESPAVKLPLEQEGAELAVTGPQAFGAFHKADIARWKKVIRESNIVLE